MPLPEKMSVYELEQAIKEQPENEWLKEVMVKKLRRTSVSDYEVLKKDYLHYS
jgi:hypothetical protein